MTADVLDRLRAAAARVCPARRILVAYAYGSRVSGRPRAGSDLDVGYYLLGGHAGHRLSLREEMAAQSELSDAVGLEIDLRDLAEAPLELRGRVLEDGVRIYSRDDVARVGLERDLLARYHDYKDVFRQMHEVRLQALAKRGV